EFITYAAGIDANGAFRNLEVMTYRETYGDEIRNPRWRAQFKGKRVDAALKLDDDIHNISGATLSCLHVTEGVKRLLALHKAALE
ncbi:MAG TPA: FMN-binding protein, partial [Burkholderiaceae bacterium]|nr:FMN-binding protein [Burkholderiaceae bacterium]